jgi:hypothetical protein
MVDTECIYCRRKDADAVPCAKCMHFFVCSGDMCQEFLRSYSFHGSVCDAIVAAPSMDEKDLAVIRRAAECIRDHIHEIHDQRKDEERTPHLCRHNTEQATIKIR